MKSIVILLLSVLFISQAHLFISQAHSQACYWQAPVADHAANPPPYWTQRCDLGVLPTMNDPANLDHIEVINPGSNSAVYLPDVAQAIAPDANGYPQLLNYILPFTPKRSTDVKLLFQTQAPVFHFYSPSIAPYCIGIAPPICSSYTTANPAWANYARVWLTRHNTYQNLSMVLQLPPNILPLGAWVKLLIDSQPDGSDNHMWVIAE
jgi:hypothetical protein